MRALCSGGCDLNEKKICRCTRDAWSKFNKFCSVCGFYINDDSLRCFCCNSKYRVRPREPEAIQKIVKRKHRY